MAAPTDKQIPSLATYSLLGRSGLRVSPLCLGTMTFGAEGWGVDEESAVKLLDRYAEAGGNFIDTAENYSLGQSEEIVGRWLHERKARDRVVVGTKLSWNVERGNPNAGGNGRKNLLRALEGSLRRLQTDFIDLYWVHVWDGLTPIDELMRTLDDVVRAGKVRAIGFSNAPAWVIARAQTLAELRGWEKLCALQLEYSLVERHIEREHVPMALELGLGVMPWSPLASGLLSGKHQRGATAATVEGEGRLRAFAKSTHPSFAKLYRDRNWQIADVTKDVAQKLGRSPAQVALSWAATRPSVVSTVIGATTLAQLEDNLHALDLALPAELSATLEDAGRPEAVNPYLLFDNPKAQRMITGGPAVTASPPWTRPR